MNVRVCNFASHGESVGSVTVDRALQLRQQLVDLMHMHPPHVWSAGALAAVIAVLTLDAGSAAAKLFPEQLSDEVGSRPSLRIL